MNLAPRQFPKSSTGVLTPILRSKEVFTLKAEDGFQDRIVTVGTGTARYPQVVGLLDDVLLPPLLTAGCQKQGPSCQRLRVSVALWVGVMPLTVLPFCLTKLNIEDLGLHCYFRFSTLLTPSMRAK